MIFQISLEIFQSEVLATSRTHKSQILSSDMSISSSLSLFGYNMGRINLSNTCIVFLELPFFIEACEAYVLFLDFYRLEIGRQLLLPQLGGREFCQTFETERKIFGLSICQKSDIVASH